MNDLLELELAAIASDVEAAIEVTVVRDQTGHQVTVHPNELIIDCSPGAADVITEEQLFILLGDVEVCCEVQDYDGRQVTLSISALS